MAFLSLSEIIDITIMTLVVGYIFIDSFRTYAHNTKDAFLLSIAAVAPAIILHEFGHKIIGILFGFDATFNAAYPWLFIGIVLKILSGFVFFVPAYVSLSCPADCIITPGASALIAFAGPLINATLYLGALLALKYGTWTPKQHLLLRATQKINGILFLFNMLPIPLFDGFKVYEGIWRILTA